MHGLKYERRKDIRKAVAERVSALLRTELADGDSFMQDLWDACADDNDELAVEDALRGLIERISGDQRMVTRRLVSVEEGLTK